ncbi:MAG: class I adenylate-forming enzyme family protein [Candidatus Dormibacteraceae bacterium]
MTAGRLVQSLLQDQATSAPDRLALVGGEERWTYGSLAEAAHGVARALRQNGVGRGDRVVLLLPADARAVISIFGVLEAEATFVVLHPSTKVDRLAQILGDAEPAAMITDRRRLHGAEAQIAALPSLRLLVMADDAPNPIASLPSLAWSGIRPAAAAPPCRSISQDLATLIYTSGTTGRAKGVMSTHGNVLAATGAINAYLRHTPDDVVLDLLPLAFDYGLFQLFLAFQAGARVVLEPGFAFPARLAELVEQERVTGLPCVPTIVATLLRQPSIMAPLRRLRYVTNTGAALPVAHLRELQRLLPETELISMYGLTECKRVSYLPPDQLARRPGSVGIPIPGTEVTVVDEAGREVPAGVPGELVVRGAHVTRGYWRDPAASARRFRPGAIPGETVLYTGDVFTRDADGYLTFVGRTDDIIKTRGEKVSPREVEGVVCQLEGVLEAAVVGVPDPLLGEAVLLCVTARQDAELTERAVRAHCAARLDSFMQPAQVRIVAALPRTDNGKVDKRRLAQDLLSQASVQETVP